MPTLYDLHKGSNVNWLLTPGDDLLRGFMDERVRNTLTHKHGKPSRMVICCLTSGKFSYVYYGW